MTQNALSKTLKQEAIELGLCLQWQEEWQEEASNQSLIDKYFEGLDFPTKHHWPSNSFIKENFEKELLWQNNIFVDDTRSVLNPKKMVVLGTSNIKIRVNAHNRSVIYIRDNSKVEMIVKNDAFAIVHLFEQANVSIETLDKPNVLVLKHSNDAKCSSSRNVKIKEDFDYLK